MSRYQFLAPIILRLGLGAVMIWFGFQQFAHPAAWTSFLPAWVGGLAVSQITFIYLNAWLEVCLGALLIIGFYTRWAALFLALHLAGILLSLGYNAIAVRDFGLTLALFSLALQGAGHWSLDRYWTEA